MSNAVVPGSSTSPGTDDDGARQGQDKAAAGAGAGAGAATTTTTTTAITNPLSAPRVVPAPALDPTIRRKLISSGERDRLKRLLAERLEQCGWRDQLSAAAAAHLRATHEAEREAEPAPGGVGAAEGATTTTTTTTTETAKTKTRTTTTAAQLAAALTPAAQAAVPDSVKAEVLAALRSSVLSF